MGFTPNQVREMSFWDFAMLWEDYVDENSGDQIEAPSEEELDDQIARLMKAN